MKPIIPFEPTVAKSVPQGSEWIGQIKWDGVRILTYYDGKSVKLFNRRLKERTMQFPELEDIHSYCKCNSLILDGEMISLVNGKPSFNAIMKRDGIIKDANLPRAIKETSVAYMIFDIIYFNDKWTIKQSLKERQSLLKEILIPQQNVQLVENFSDIAGLYKVIEQQGMEGVVCKNLTSTYAINGKDDRWQKLKNYRDVTAVVGGFTLRGNTVNALLLGLYDDYGNLVYVGHAGTGKLTQNEWRNLSSVFAPIITPNSPFNAKTTSSLKPYWVKPKLTVKIKFSEWTPSGSLRQPSIQAFTNTPPEECKFPA